MSNIEQAISLPFTLGITGSVQTTIDQRKIWGDRVLSVIGTALGERPQRYYFGSKIHFELFQDVAAAETQLYRDISETFSRYLPLLSFIELKTAYNKDDGTLEVTVLYSLPDETQESATVGIVQITGNQPPKEL